MHPADVVGGPACPGNHPWREVQCAALPSVRRSPARHAKVARVTGVLTGELGGAADGESGVVANSRLTSSTGVVLTCVLLIEGFTILDVHGYITAHTAIGLVLIGPLALKCATTIYRFARYYTGSPGYRRRGAPPLVLRLIGPFVMVSSIAVLSSGVALLAGHGRSGDWLTVHKGSFLVWLGLTAVHFLGHIYQAVRETTDDLRSSAGRFAPGRALRLLAVTASLVLGVGIAAAFTPSASSWHQPSHHDHGRSASTPR